MTHHALIPAAGNGFRFGAGIPKQYLLLHGKPVLQHALDRLRAQFPLAMTYVALSAEDRWFEDLIAPSDDVTALRCGGATRSESVRNALECIRNAQQDDWIVVHDAVRPCLTAETSSRLQRELADDPVGGFLAVPVSDTLKRLDEGRRVVRTEPREALWRAQTPQMFRYGLLREALARPVSEHSTDEAHAVEALGMTPRAVMGSAFNLKITYPEDLLLAAAILAAEPNVRIDASSSAMTMGAGG